MSRRKLRDDEWFSVILQCRVPGNRSPSAGNADSLYNWIGVTTTSPYKMMDHATPLTLKSHCWLVRIGEGEFASFKDGRIVDPKLGDYPISKQIGFRYSVCRGSNGDLRFSVNGLEFGVAARRVPENVFGYVFLSRHDEKLLISP